MPYPYSFVSQMQMQKGKVFTIREIREGQCSRSENRDKRLYLFKEYGYHWHSLMFEPIDDRFYEGFFIPEFKIVL